ncbi:ribosomal protein S9 domain-containing protein, putative [Eimeria tenella]|uniref:Ribosomal protein S9 domain-containing protein, putative n=1 Tax=Eimeria tenella TaxID=5802 RepID=U6L7S8_EIMTE|nr:ribosomal protein S9 domain-containing protein, putative [Eimeria tenella]CDJ43845.1 ribosomal protein S9 domain-containing protein, putative [Eimeria tenella]|eukprot:XP_013234594.1 ribosomal protein S9 domain-containing protein, putative [Eimeria tenella]
MLPLTQRLAAARDGASRTLLLRQQQLLLQQQQHRCQLPRQLQQWKQCVTRKQLQQQLQQQQQLLLLRRGLATFSRFSRHPPNPAAAAATQPPAAAATQPATAAAAAAAAAARHSRFSRGPAAPQQQQRQQQQQQQRIPSPGKDMPPLSLSEALYLAKEGGCFTVKELQKIVLTAPSFSSDSSPFLLENFFRSLGSDDPNNPNDPTDPSGETLETGDSPEETQTNSAEPAAAAAAAADGLLRAHTFEHGGRVWLCTAMGQGTRKRAAAVALLTRGTGQVLSPLGSCGIVWGRSRDRVGSCCVYGSRVCGIELAALGSCAWACGVARVSAGIVWDRVGIAGDCVGTLRDIVGSPGIAWDRVGSCQVRVCGREEVYTRWPYVYNRMEVLQPLLLAAAAGLFDVDIQVRGGGPSGQAGAARLAVARALVAACEDCQPALQEGKP